jgi:hypothetical protein
MGSLSCGGTCGRKAAGLGRGRNRITALQIRFLDGKARYSRDLVCAWLVNGSDHWPIVLHQGSTSRGWNGRLCHSEGDRRRTGFLQQVEAMSKDATRARTCCASLHTRLVWKLPWENLCGTWQLLSFSIFYEKASPFMNLNARSPSCCAPHSLDVRALCFGKNKWFEDMPSSLV